MRPAIPLEVLGLIGPILSWVEGSQTQAIPKTWAGEHVLPFSPSLRPLGEPSWAPTAQERGWLLNELPTYSLDNVDEVVAFSRSGGHSPRSPDRTSFLRTRVEPPPGYDLWHILEMLSERYLIWNGGKVAIRTGRMVELHELGLRMPLGFIVRHVHARAVAAGEQHLWDVSNLPEAVSLLPSNSHGLRTVIRRGLSEGHLHLNSVHATEVAWADHLLKPIGSKPKTFEVVEWRLLRLARAAVRILALATALVRVSDTCHRVSPNPLDNLEVSWVRLLRLYDAMYFASRDSLMTSLETRFQEEFREVVSKSMSPSGLLNADRWVQSAGRSQDNPSQNQIGLRHWLDPFGLTHHRLRSPKNYLPLRSPVEREECLALLHLAAHLALIEAPRLIASPLDNGMGGQNNFRKSPSWTYPTPEGRFLHHALFRYLVCQTHHWQLGVQQGRTTGLRHFKQYYDSNQRWPLQATSREEAKAVLRRARDWRGLRVLEGRVPPPRHSRDLLPWLTEFASNTREGRVEKMGLVVHFIKVAGRRNHGNIFSRARYAEQRAVYRRQAFDLFRILETPSAVTPFIVGIDAANLELVTPPEVFAPVFRFLRDRPIALREAEMFSPDEWSLYPKICKLVERRRLGMTYHVGEEFRHLLSGLRAIDEVLEFLAPRSGDRIGHGIALGLNPRVWLDHVGRQALVSKQEWLDTLVWVHQLLGAGDDTLGRLRVEEDIEHLGRQLYLGRNQASNSGKGDSSRSITPLLFRDVWLLRQLDPEMFELDQDGNIRFREVAGDDSATWRWNCTMRRMLRDVEQRVGPNAPTDLLSRYWYNQETSKRGDELILIDMEEDLDSWLEVCSKAQRRMQHRIARRQIAVEVNPSANRVIGPMNRYEDHHVFDLTFDGEKEWKRWLRVTVNTDNPGTANTCLTHEFYLLGEALIGSGVAEAEVVEWLEWLRQSGEESSFVRQLPKPESQVMQRLTAHLREANRPFRDIRSPDKLASELWRQLSSQGKPDPVTNTG